MPAARTATRWLSAEQQRIWRTFLLGSVCLNERLDDALREFGLDLAEYEILVRLSESDDRRIRMSELAEAVRSSRSRLTHTVARLEKAGLVARTTCPVDRRGVWAELTPAGTALLTEVAPSHVRSVRENLVEAVDPADFEALGRVFAAVLGANGRPADRCR